MELDAFDLLSRQRHLDRMDREAAKIVHALADDDIDAMAEDLCEQLKDLPDDPAMADDSA